jgi:alcohol oxidase
VGRGPKNEHGFDGPIHVSRGTHTSKVLEDDFIAATSQLGWPEIEDLQALDANNGVSRASRFISPDGKRQDTASCYIHPRLADGKHPNLTVLVEHQVVRVLFDDEKRVVGVEFQTNPALQPEAGSTVQHVKVRNTVVLSAGACGTPLIMERSGLGDENTLKRARIPHVENLPGVGHDYQDHQLGIYPYYSSLDPDQTLDALLTGRKDVSNAIQTKDSQLGWNGQDLTVKIRPTEADVAALGREFQEAWDLDFKDKQDKALIQMAPIGG